MLRSNAILIILLVLAEHSQEKEESYTVAEYAVKKESIASCCNQNISCACSLYSTLQKANGSSSSIIINITTDVTLPLVLQLINITNITIVGHNNPTVNCNNTGALHFTSSHGITIQGIKWEECGNNNQYTSLSMYDCSGVNIITVLLTLPPPNQFY